VTRTSIHEYVAAQRPRYLTASRREKRRILDEVVAVIGYHCKAALRRLHRPPRTPPRAVRTGRPPSLWAGRHPRRSGTLEGKGFLQKLSIRLASRFVLQPTVGLHVSRLSIPETIPQSS
jgi:hypothetical protein